MIKLREKNIGIIKINVPAQEATPSGSISAALGQKGIKPMEFCKIFNETSINFTKGKIINVKVNLLSGKKFTLQIKGITTINLIKEILGVEKLNNDKISISQDQIYEIVKLKMQYLNTTHKEKAYNIIIGTLKSAGISIIK